MRRQSRELECEWRVEWVDGEEVLVYPGLESDSVAFWNKYKDFLEGAGTIEKVADVLENIFGVILYGINLCPPTPSSEGNDADTCRAWQIQLAIIRMSRSIEYVPPGSLWISARSIRIFDSSLGNGNDNISAYHLAIENGPRFTMTPSFPLDFPAVFSGLPEDNLQSPSGDELVGHVNAESNSEFFRVVPINYTQPTSQVLLDLYDMTDYYCDCLPYGAIPAGGEYNSNGYVHGLINASGGIPDWAWVGSPWQGPPALLLEVVGWNSPVPSYYFSP